MAVDLTTRFKKLLNSCGMGLPQGIFDIESAGIDRASETDGIIF